MLLVAVVIGIGFDVFGIIYESWLRSTFAMSTVAIGSLAWVFSVAEVCGEVCVILLADRLGKRRLTLGAFTGTAATYFLLPHTAQSFPLALAALFLLFFTYEIGVVALIPVVGEAAPESRGLMMSMNVAAVAIGRASGTLLGGALYRTAGFGVNGTVSAGLTLIGVVLLWRFMVRRNLH
jgi:predicted MFS family arabinose efflux permease